MEHLYISCVVLVALLAVAGALCPWFDDTLTQRIALMLIALGGWAEFVCYLGPACTKPNARALFALGLALYGIGTLIKTLRYRAQSSRRN